MTQPVIFNPALFTASNISLLTKKFNEGYPFRFLVIDDLLDEDFARSILNNFPSLKEMKKNYKGLNEKKSEDSDFDSLSPSFALLKNALAAEPFKRFIEDITSVTNLQAINDRLGYGLHQGGNDSFLDIHIDYNLHPIHHLFRKLNLIIFFNKEWQDEWGGNLEFWDKDVKNCIQRISPSFNRCVIFECSDISYHGYSRISVPDHITRKSLYHYYFITPPAKLAFHDTIFKPRPEETVLKKIFTPVKEQLKNFAKRTLLKLNIRKYLK